MIHSLSSDFRKKYSCNNVFLGFLLLFPSKWHCHRWDSIWRPFSKQKHLSFLTILTGHSYIFTAPKRSLGQGNIFTPVCHSIHRGGVCLSACWDTPPPPRQGTHPRPGIPPRSGTRPLDQAHQPRRRACWKIRSTRGRYASYWNAILSVIKMMTYWFLVLSSI